MSTPMEPTLWSAGGITVLVVPKPKSVGVIVPNPLIWPDSTIVLDVKADLTKKRPRR